MSSLLSIKKSIKFVLLTCLVKPLTLMVAILSRVILFCRGTESMGRVGLDGVRHRQSGLLTFGADYIGPIPSYPIPFSKAWRLGRAPCLRVFGVWVGVVRYITLNKIYTGAYVPGHIWVVYGFFIFF